METVKTVTMIPADPRNGKPLVTSAMKAVCIGEFNIPVEHSCDCDHDDACEQCGGTGTWTQQVAIPWDTMKDIYKMMASVAAGGVTAGIDPPVFTVGFDPPMKGDRAAVAIRHDDQMGVFTVKPQ